MSRSLMMVSLLIPQALFGLLLVSSSAQDDPPKNPQKAPAANEGPEAEKPAVKPVEIADEPKTIDPATLVPKPLAEKVTVQFAESSLTEVVKWLQEERQLSVLLDLQAFTEASILVSEPVVEQLDDEPLYLLLDRLRTLGLDWYQEDGVLHLTTIQAASRHLTTSPYEVGDLIDAGFEPHRLIETLKIGTQGPWATGQNTNSDIMLLGDVLFVRQTDHVHREVAGLLAALRKPAQRIFAMDSPHHAVLRDKLLKKVTIDFQDVTLTAAVQELSRQAEVDIRLDRTAFRRRNLRERTPVSLRLTDQKLSVVLQSLVVNWEFTWILRDGVLWITSHEEAEQLRKTAVFDVRDLCRDDRDSSALQQAILGQTQGPWKGEGRDGGSLKFARTGILVVRQSERGLADVLQLLENYRTALRASKPRVNKAVDKKEVVTHYYRLPKNMADNLEEVLPSLVRPETWKNDDQPEAPGTIRKIASRTQLLNSDGYEVISGEADPGQPHQRALVVEHSVLIIRQMREVHEKISDLLNLAEEGDLPEGSGSGMMGGMGGGFFSVLPQKR